MLRANVLLTDGIMCTVLNTADFEKAKQRLKPLVTKALADGRLRPDSLAVLLYGPDAATALRPDRPPLNKAEFDEEIRRLAALAPLQYNHEREGAAKKLGMQVPMLDSMRALMLHTERKANGNGPDKVDADLLKDLPDGGGAQGAGDRAGEHLAGGNQASEESVDFSRIPLTTEEWLNRDLPEPDRIMGEWLTTTSRVLLNAPTGIGKTNFAMAIAAYAAAGRDFLHWRAHRPARVLFIDGEMSRRLLKKRAQDVVRRLELKPTSLFLLSHEDVPDFQPLNTPAGKAFIEQTIEKVGGIDVVVFDNVMALVAGDMKEEDGWQRVLPLIHSLTKRGVGQLWVHHTGHDASRSYGTKTREWRMDTVVHLTEVPRAKTDVSFTLEFQKARERTPETRRDFEDVTIALIDDKWVCSAATERQAKPSPLGAKFLEALQDAFTDGETVTFQGWKTVKVDLWRAECAKRGLIDPAAKPDSARNLFNKYKRELIGRNLIGCHDDLVWPL